MEIEQLDEIGVQYRTIIDFGGEDYLYFENGLENYFDLSFRTFEVNSLKHFCWIIRVLRYLNPDKTKDEIIQVSDMINSIFSSGKYSSDIIRERVDLMFFDEPAPPPVSPRKVIFNPLSHITADEKMKIVNDLIHRKISPAEVENAVFRLHYDNGMKISRKALAEELCVSDKTIARHTSEDTKETIKSLNNKLEQEDIVQCIEHLQGQFGKVPSKLMVRKMFSKYPYKKIKEAFDLFFDGLKDR